MNKKIYDIFNISSLIVVFILLMMMLTLDIPNEWIVYIASLAIVLLIIRIFLRIKISLQSKKKV